MGSVVPFESAGVPAHISKRFGGAEANTDLTSGVGNGGYPVISYKGKVWHIVEGDDRTLVEGENGDPRASLELVILRANPNISKVYYPNGYEEGSTEKPSCYSNDGKAPAADAQSPQAKSCAVCPHNQWGSRITESGGKGKECSDSRRLAVVPSGDLERPMLLRVPAASLKELVAYADLLNRRKTPYQAVVTKVTFDHTVAHPKLVFKPIRWLTDDELDIVTEVGARSVVESILSGGAAPAALPPAEAQDEEFALGGERPAGAGGRRRTASVSDQELDAALAQDEAPAPAPKAAAKPAPAPKAAAKPAPAPKAAAKPAPAPKAAMKGTPLAEADAELDAILAEIDDE